MKLWPRYGHGHGFRRTNIRGPGHCIMPAPQCICYEAVSAISGRRRASGDTPSEWDPAILREDWRHLRYQHSPRPTTFEAIFIAKASHCRGICDGNDKGGMRAAPNAIFVDPQIQSGHKSTKGRSRFPRLLNTNIYTARFLSIHFYSLATILVATSSASSSSRYITLSSRFLPRSSPSAFPCLRSRATPLAKVDRIRTFVKASLASL
jgi:hypothetical protein